MKTKKLLKALGVVLAAVALVVVSVLGTMAWLTSTTDKFVNTITVGNVFIELSETNVNGDDTPLTNSYAVVPGVATDKDPKVTVLANSAKAYVRVLVTVDNATAWGTAFPSAVNVDSAKWTLVDDEPDAVGGKLVYQCPSLEEVRTYCLEQVDKLWDEVKRFDNPHTYYVDLSQKLWDVKYGLLKENNIK